MIPPDYTALEMKARFYASRRRASGGYTLAEFLEESADALALAASLQDEIGKVRAVSEALKLSLGGIARNEREMRDYAQAEAKRLQDEIERLKGEKDCEWCEEREATLRLCEPCIEEYGIPLNKMGSLAPETGAT